MSWSCLNSFFAGLSETRLKARFKAETDVPPADYVMRRMIEVSKTLLVGDQPVTDIAIGLGFSTTQYFATVFK